MQSRNLSFLDSSLLTLGRDGHGWRIIEQKTAVIVCKINNNLPVEPVCSAQFSATVVSALLHLGYDSTGSTVSALAADGS